MGFGQNQEDCLLITTTATTGGIVAGEKGKQMGWHEDHRNTVADRWAKKYHESGMTADKFSKHMKKTMLEYGWSESDATKMVARAMGKDDAQ